MKKKFYQKCKETNQPSSWLNRTKKAAQKDKFVTDKI